MKPNPEFLYEFQLARIEQKHGLEPIKTGFSINNLKKTQMPALGSSSGNKLNETSNHSTALEWYNSGLT